MNKTKCSLTMLLIAFSLSLCACQAGDSESVSSTHNNSSSSDMEAIVHDTEITTKSNADTTTATVKGSESNVIKPNNAAYDDEVDFLENAEQLVNSVEQIEELKRSLLEIEGVTDVQIYNSDDDSQDTELQITEGKAEKGMVVKVFYDNGGSWAKYTKQ
ncbi:unknown [Eubacterium sp. CAG:786]|nr:unknown [Eubacterium sp. CAG:786]